jgi:hypothetical protein
VKYNAKHCSAEKKLKQPTEKEFNFKIAETTFASRLCPFFKLSEFCEEF